MSDKEIRQDMRENGIVGHREPRTHCPVAPPQELLQDFEYKLPLEQHSFASGFCSQL
jgi:hypothetical protein